MKKLVEAATEFAEKISECKYRMDILFDSLDIYWNNNGDYAYVV